MVSFIVFPTFGLFCAYIILIYKLLCKGAILVFLHNFHISDRQRDFTKCLFHNITCGNADSIKGLRCIEIDNIRKVITVKIFRGINSALAHQHIGYAVYDKLFVNDFDIEIVKLLQKAILQIIFKLCGIVLQVVLYGIFLSFHQHISKSVLFHLSKPVREPFDDRLLIPFINLPYRTGSASISYIKIIFKGVSPSLCIKDSDTLTVLVYPTLKLLVPSFNLSNRNGSKALSINQELLIETELIVAVGRSQKVMPCL